VLDWHPGGKAPIMAHAGKVHVDTTDEFESIHDDYAEQKLSGKISCPKSVLVHKLTGWL
jgi:nitrate reductase (NAD(P)H)